MGIPPVNPLTDAFASAVIPVPHTWKVIEWVVTILLSLFFMVTGMLTGIRSLLTFGIDYMGLVYLYYPEESKIQNHNVYSIVRHPAYFGLLLVAFGGVLHQLSIYASVTFIIVLTGFTCHIKLVEERELIKRFGAAFVKYQQQVPALYLKPAKIIPFCKFLLGFSD